VNRAEFERHISAYIDDELSVETRREMEAFMDQDQEARAEFETHLAAWEAAQEVPVGRAPEDLWSSIEAALQAQGTGASLEDLALMLRGLAGEVRELRRAVDGLRRDLEEAGWEEEREAAGDIRVRASIAPDRPRRGSLEQLRRTS
jgi:hypothetical protein